ncbi:MAG: T9SS type A sorting domain-containing protein [bacterium]|nr:T9SS type A sorting domain-containing protein [bacterium]
MKRVVWLVFLLSAGLSLAQEGGTPNSEWMYVGNTWRDYQGNGTLGRMIAVGPNGDVHFVWTNGLSDGLARDCFYNCWDDASDSLLSQDGYSMNGFHRSSYPTIVVHSHGYGVSSFNSLHYTGQPAVATAFDFFPCSGAFTPYWAGVGDSIAYWPKTDMDRQDRIHLVGTSFEPEMRIYYARAFIDDTSNMDFEIIWDVTLVEIASEGIISPGVDIACSRLSDRVAVAWVVDPPGDYDPENIVMRISDDGGETWSGVLPVTDLPPIDTMCTQAPEICNGDTFRPWHDLSILLDDDDNVHIAFSASGYYYFDENGEANPGHTYLSSIWHWSEFTQEFTLIGEAWHPHDTHALGENNLMCQKPSLAIDTTTGYMYCGFQQFDRRAYSVSGYPMGEFYLSKSWDLGASWTLPINVSNTPGDTAMPENGDHPSERDITLAKYVTDGTVHAQYIHDRSAGSTPWFEGETTLNEVVYMRVPDRDMPWLPLQEQWQFRATGTSANDLPQLPRQFTLYQNYPNPFNPSTTIQFDLAKAGNVKLAVFDVTGRTVATLVDGAMSAGAHSVEFDGANLTSGVYFARLEMGGTTMTRKMVLIK